MTSEIMKSILSTPVYRPKPRTPAPTEINYFTGLVHVQFYSDVIPRLLDRWYKVKYEWKVSTTHTALDIPFARRLSYMSPPIDVE